MWRANLCKWPGWSMKGGGREQAGQRAGRPAGAETRCGAPKRRRALPCRPGPPLPPRRSEAPLYPPTRRRPVDRPAERGLRSLPRRPQAGPPAQQGACRAVQAGLRPAAAWGGCPGTPGHLSRPSNSCAYHPIHTASLLSGSLRSAGGSAASGASLPRSRPRPLGPRRERAAAKGAGDDVLDPEGWALWVTGLCLPLPLSLWGSALGLGSRRRRSQRLLLGRLGAVWDPPRRLPPTADGALGNSEGESGWGPRLYRRKPARRGLRRPVDLGRRPG